MYQRARAGICGTLPLAGLRLATTLVQPSSSPLASGTADDVAACLLVAGGLRPPADVGLGGRLRSAIARGGCGSGASSSVEGRAARTCKVLMMLGALMSRGVGGGGCVSGGHGLLPLWSHSRQW